MHLDEKWVAKSKQFRPAHWDKPHTTVYDVPKPSPAHLAFHEDTFGVIIHFNYLTYLPPGNRTPDAVLDAAQFSPSSEKFTAQWLSLARDVGAKYAVYVADHFSGFSTWPSELSTFTVKHSPWRFGMGNVVADFLESAEEHGIRPGVFYSFHNNWHRHVVNFNATTVDVLFQLARFKELLDEFGDNPAAQVWLDDGLQGELLIEEFNKIIQTLENSNTTCHHCGSASAAHAVSWMGNELARMPYPNWNSQNQDCSDFDGNHYGSPDGTRYCPSHCDGVLNQHFWFWEPYTSDRRYTVPELLANYFTSVGRGCNFVLNMGPDTTGFLPKPDVERYLEFGLWRRRTFESPLIESYFMFYTDSNNKEHFVTTLTPMQTIGNHRYHLALEGLQDAHQLTIACRFLPTKSKASARVSYVAVHDWSDWLFDDFVAAVQNVTATMGE
ncbi:hypothetical protein PTSG_09867 [Salpingoeca rosetta]|uniref:alpha-L-fucosidase n=1 Tax=Salpingoeca rosetta (strain ATCC 50818 / BSB-021) TaxID=946362 RepID=F2UND2_SALR5|nr:uncharacterized protein PTSG_09867 [Salpingoeca rosetta]EGD79137.1 hypothetical protein PTSG_09867 [Salpingoeca rosetta]|eukprot:XP_004989222.1 hypothetical protein PTSG_09867 [Salpingoeca rosetta]